MHTGILLNIPTELALKIKNFWPEPNFISWSMANNVVDSAQMILESPLPDIIIAFVDNQSTVCAEITKLIKSENVYRQIPILICINQEDYATGLDFNAIEADDFFIISSSEQELKNRIELTLKRSSRTLDANPLTRLPGNTNILRYVTDQIANGKEFALGYCDLDFFKPFNDKYGFARGDEVLLMTARVILNSVRAISPHDFFVGHVGGDDFIFVVPSQLAETICKEIIHNFDAIITQFYDIEDREKKGIISVDRKGKTSNFDIMSISIAVVDNKNKVLTHVGEASYIASSVKAKVKQHSGSSYLIDRRQYGEGQRTDSKCL